MLLSRRRLRLAIAVAALGIPAGFLLAGNMASQTSSVASRQPTEFRRGVVTADVKPFDLPEMVKSAGRIFRGTLVSAEPGSAAVGGGRLPVVTYRFKVEEGFLGDFNTVKGVPVAEITMIGKAKGRSATDGQRAKLLPDMPEYTPGETYLLFATSPSAAGLSTTVGLGQGSFRVGAVGKSETVLNGANNRGLLKNDASSARSAAAAAPEGPIAYTDFSARIREELNKTGRTK